MATPVKPQRLESVVEETFTPSKGAKVAIIFFANCVNFQSRAFAMYLPDLKLKFVLSQASVELLMAMNYLGFTSALPGGYLVSRCGLCKVGAGSLLISTAAFLLIWSSNNAALFYHQHPYLLHLYFFLAGCGCGGSYVVATTAMARLMAGKWRGMAMSILAVSLDVGPIIFVSIYQYALKHVHMIKDVDQDEERTYLRTYFLVVASATFALNLVSLWAYWSTEATPVVKPGNQLSSTDVANNSDEGSTFDGSYSENPTSKTAPGEVNTKKQAPAKSSSGVEGVVKRRTNCCGCLVEVSAEERSNLVFWDVIRVPRWHLVIWSSICLLGLKWMSVGNVTTFLGSYHLEQYETVVLYLVPVSSIVVKMAHGVLAGHRPPKLPASTLLIPTALANILAFGLAIPLLGRIYIFFFIVILWTINGVTVATPLILIDDFGMKSFSTSIGTVYCGQSILTCVSQFMVGALYDVYAHEEPSGGSHVNTTSAYVAENVQLGKVLRPGLLLSSRDEVTPSGEDGLEGSISVCFGSICFLWSFIISLLLCLISLVLLIVHIVMKCGERREAVDEEKAAILQSTQGPKANYGIQQKQ